MAQTLDSVRVAIMKTERRIEELDHDCEERRQLRRELKDLMDDLASREAQLRNKGWRT